MKNRCAVALLVVSLVAGVYAADPPKTREVQADPVQRAAMDKLSRQGAEINEAQARLEAAIKAHRAETAAIMSSIRAAHALAPGEDFTAYDQARGVFTVTLATDAPAGAPPVAGK